MRSRNFGRDSSNGAFSSPSVTTASACRAAVRSDFGPWAATYSGGRGERGERRPGLEDQHVRDAGNREVVGNPADLEPERLDEAEIVAQLRVRDELPDKGPEANRHRRNLTGSVREGDRLLPARNGD